MDNIKTIVKEKLREVANDAKTFLFYELPSSDRADVNLINNARKVIIFSVIALFVCASLGITSIFRKTLSPDVLLIIALIAILTLIFSFVSGIIYIKRYLNGDYKILAGIVTDVERNPLTREVVNVYMTDNEGESHSFRVEKGISIKKKRRYEVCYYDTDYDVSLIVEAKYLGKVTKEEKEEKEE